MTSKVTHPIAALKGDGPCRLLVNNQGETDQDTCKPVLQIADGGNASSTDFIPRIVANEVITMTVSIAHLSLDDLKDQARRLRHEMSKEGTEINHSRALEILAHQLGYKDWNTLHALIGNRPPGPPVAVGQTVTGKFMGQTFIADVLGIRAIPNSNRFRMTLQLDEPIDVVTFDSFSNFRKRVSCTVDRTGKSVEKLSNGERHMVLDL